MLESIQKAIESPAGSFSFVFSMMLLAGWVVYYVTRFTTKIRTLPCDKHTKKLDTLKTDVSILKTDVAVAKTDISYMKNTLSFALNVKDSSIKRNSPLSLSDIGEEIAASNKLNDMVNDNWSKIRAVLDDYKSRNPYDLQEYCFETAFCDTIRTPVFFSEKDVDRLKITAYKSGTAIMSMTRVLGILIRDRYFSENGINVDDVDNHDPNLKLSV